MALNHPGNRSIVHAPLSVSSRFGRVELGLESRRATARIAARLPNGSKELPRWQAALRCFTLTTFRRIDTSWTTP